MELMNQDITTAYKKNEQQGTNFVRKKKKKLTTLFPSFYIFFILNEASSYLY